MTDLIGGILFILPNKVIPAGSNVRDARLRNVQYYVVDNSDFLHIQLILLINWL